MKKSFDVLGVVEVRADIITSFVEKPDEEWEQTHKLRRQRQLEAGEEPDVDLLEVPMVQVEVHSHGLTCLVFDGQNDHRYSLQPVK